MPSFEADPTNFAELLEIVRDGYEIYLKPGDDKGLFMIDSAIAIRGNVCRGNPSVVAPYMFAVDARAVVVKS